jgi:hypothetical protein
MKNFTQPPEMVVSGARCYTDANMSSRKSSPRRKAKSAPGRPASKRTKALLAYGRMVLDTEARAIGSLRLDDRFATAVEWGARGRWC